MVELTAMPVDLGRLVAAVEHPSCGGLAIFAGVVRADGPTENPVVALEYSAYDSMVLKQLQRLGEQARERFAIHEVAIAHRVGRLAVGETSVVVAVSAPHRAAAFDACRWVIDTLKRDVPIWKKEIRKNGESSWASPTT